MGRKRKPTYIDIEKTVPRKFKLLHLKDMRKDAKGYYTGHASVETKVVLETGTIAVEAEALVKKPRELKMAYMSIEGESSRSVARIPRSLKYLEWVKTISRSGK